MGHLGNALSRIWRVFLKSRKSAVSSAAPSAMPIVDVDEVTSWFTRHECCPDCGGKEFIPGPRGGLSQNMTCSGCGSEFNIARFEGRVFLAARIDRSVVGRGIVGLPDQATPRTLN